MPSPPVAVVEAFPEAQGTRPANGNHHLQVELPADEASSAGEIWGWGWLFWEHRRLLLRAMAWGLAISTLVAFLIPKRYDSTIRLMPPDGQTGSGLAMLAAMAGKSGLGMGSMAGNLLGLKSSGALFVDILRSRTVQDRMVNRFDLRKVYGERYWVDARKRLGRYTDVAEDRKSEVITIRVNDRDPGRAAAMAQAYVDELDHLVAEVSTSSARRERIFIEDRLASVKRELDRASREFSEFASRNATLDIGIQGKAMVEAAGRLQGELIASRSELQGLEQTYTGSNIRVRSLRARVEELSRQLDKLDGTSASGNASAGDVEDKGNSAASLSGDFPSIRQLPILGVRWADLYRQTKIEETVYELLTQQYELAKIEEAKEIPTVKVLDAAEVPEKKSSPARLEIILLGGFFALLAAASSIVAGFLWHATGENDPRRALARSVWIALRESRIAAWAQSSLTRRRRTGPSTAEPA